MSTRHVEISIPKAVKLENLDNLILETLRAALSRARFATLTALILSSVVFANVYQQALGFDQLLTQSAFHRIDNHEIEISKLSTDNPCLQKHIDEKINCVIDKPLPYAHWKIEDKIKRSKLENQIQGARNLLKEDKVGSAQIPTFSLPVSVNDLNVFCGFILVIMATWVFFNIQQVYWIIKDPLLVTIIEPHSPVLGHMFSISNPAKNYTIEWYIYVIALFPGAILLIAGVYDFWTLWDDIFSDVKHYGIIIPWVPVVLLFFFGGVVLLLSVVTLKSLARINQDLDIHIQGFRSGSGGG
jgi:hypothetical protein